MTPQSRRQEISQLTVCASATGRSTWMVGDLLVCAAIEALDPGPFRNALLLARHAEMQRRLT